MLQNIIFLEQVIILFHYFCWLFFHFGLLCLSRMMYERSAISFPVEYSLLCQFR